MQVRCPQHAILAKWKVYIIYSIGIAKAKKCTVSILVMTAVPTKTQLSNFLGTPGEDYFKGNPKSLNFYFLVIWWGKTGFLGMAATRIPTWKTKQNFREVTRWAPTSYKWSYKPYKWPKIIG